MRICSLLPSATEIVGGLGLADRLVGVSAECDWPPEVCALPVVTAARIDPSTMGSIEIDRAVREAIADGISLYAIDEELIAALDPDLIVTQDLCAVCAVSSGELTRLCSVDAEVVSLDPRTIAEIEKSVLALAERVGVPDRGAAVVAQMEEKIGRVRELVAGLERCRVFTAEWFDPPFAAGHWVPENGRARGRRGRLGSSGRGVLPDDLGRRAGTVTGARRARSLRLRRRADRARGNRFASASLSGGRRGCQRPLLTAGPTRRRRNFPTRLPPPPGGCSRSWLALDRARAR
ncbi:MAG: ABC transporter substrate-binding protein [Gaiellaceae bacterium]